jgi:hypothetical protein
MDKFWAWLANSPYASIIKIAVGGALAAILATITNADGTPTSNSLIIVIGAAFIPWLLSQINPVARAQYASYRLASTAAREVVAEKADK